MENSKKLTKMTSNKELTEQELIKRKRDYVNKVVFEITKPQREEIEKLQKKIQQNINN